MLQGWVVIVVALGYILLLFVIAYYGDRIRARGGVGARTIIYPLSLAIYCTSWTFFGSVGLASRNGYDFLTIYVGPIIMIGLASPLIAHIVRLAKAQNITSIADFIAARYGKHQGVAATVALIAIVGSIPYIALQLKAVSSSLGTILTHIDVTTGMAQPMPYDIALFVAFAMAVFAVLFGTRHIDATEHQDGLILAIATESLIKLIAFVAVGVFVTFVLFDGPMNLFAKAMEQPRAAAALTREPVWSSLVTMTLLSTVAIVLLPRQFHVTVVENRGEAEVRRAAWLFPLYLAADQPVRHSDRGRGPDDLPAGQRRQRHVRARAAAFRRLGAARAHRLRRRPVGRDRDGDRRDRRARHHGVERHRGAAGAAPARGDPLGPRGCRCDPAQRAAARDLRDPAVRLHVLPPGRRRAACRDRPVVVRRGGAARPCVLRRPDLAARHRGRRARRHDGRHPGLGLHADAAELRGRRPGRQGHPHPRAVRHLLAAPAAPARARASAAGARRAVEPVAQRARLSDLLGSRARRARSSACRPTCSRRPNAPR